MKILMLLILTVLGASAQQRPLEFSVNHILSKTSDMKYLNGRPSQLSTHFEDIGTCLRIQTNNPVLLANTNALAKWHDALATARKAEIEARTVGTNRAVFRVYYLSIKDSVRDSVSYLK